MNNLYKNDLKQLKNVFIIYSGFILLDLVLYFISYQDDFPVTMLKAIVFIASIIVPAFNLRYLFDSGNYSQYLSLPITKKQSFIIKYLSGLTVLLLPLVFYSLIALIFDLHNFGNVLIILLMIIGIYYSLGNLTAYLTTSIIMNICLQVIVFVAPIIIFICIFVVYQTFIRGIIITALPDTVLDLLIPIYSLMKAGIESVAINEILICIFYSLAFTICGFLACLKRNSLTNYHGFTNNVIAQIIKMVIIVVISWMFTGLTDVPSMSISVLFAISIIATFMTVFLIQYIYTKKIKYKANILQASIISIITLGLFLGGKSFIEDYIPGNIESVTINHDIQFALSKNLLNKNAYLKDKNMIDTVVEIHQEILDTKCSYGDYEIGIVYQLKNGRQIVRNYWLNYNDYQAIVEKFNQEMIRVWYYDYYQLVDMLDVIYQIDFADESENIDEQIINSEDIELFKNILIQQLQAFENDHSLLNEVEKSSPSSIYFGYDPKDKAIDLISYSYNDPLDRTIQEYNKIKAN